MTSWKRKRRFMTRFPFLHRQIYQDLDATDNDSRQSLFSEAAHTLTHPCTEWKHPSYLAGIFSPGAVAGAQHVFCDAAVEGLTAVAFLPGDDGELDGAEGGGDLTPAGVGEPPAWHPTHSSLRYGGALPGQQGDGDVAVQVDGGFQLGRWWTAWSVNRDGRQQIQTQRGETCNVFVYLYKHDVVIVGGDVVFRVGHQKLGQDSLFCALIDGQRVFPRNYHHSG